MPRAAPRSPRLRPETVARAIRRTPYCDGVGVPSNHSVVKKTAGPYARGSEKEGAPGRGDVFVVDDVVGQHVGKRERAPGAERADAFDDDDIPIQAPRVRPDEGDAELGAIGRGAILRDDAGIPDEHVVAVDANGEARLELADDSIRCGVPDEKKSSIALHAFAPGVELDVAHRRVVHTNAAPQVRPSACGFLVRPRLRGAASLAPQTKTIGS